MAGSEVEIVNSALIKIGESAIASLDAIQKAARVSKRQYPLMRRRLLRRARWNFAMKRESLAPESTVPKFGFDNKFMLPSDALRVVGLFDENELQQNYTSNRDPWKVEGRFIYADGSELKIFYLADITDTAQFDPQFDECLAWLLASELAFDLTSGVQYVTLTREGFKDAFKEARLSDAIEGTPEFIEASEWVDSRVGNFPLRIGPVNF